MVFELTISPRNRSLSLGSRSILEFLGEVARISPRVPAAGCVVGLCGASSAALARFVATLTHRKAEQGAWRERLEAMMERLAILEERCVHMMDRDLEVCLESFCAKLGDKEASAQGSGKAMMEPPVILLRCGIELLRISLELAERGAPVCKADAGVAGAMANACGRGALWIARSNLQGLEGQTRKIQEEMLDNMEMELEALHGRLVEEMDR
jgi:formiminotetrahydrofolate cyclodeaminase